MRKSIRHWQRSGCSPHKIRTEVGDVVYYERECLADEVSDSSEEDQFELLSESSESADLNQTLNPHPTP